MKPSAWLGMAIACLATSAISEPTALAAPVSTCPATPRQWLKTEGLETTAPEHYVFQPKGAGFIEADGALGIKHAWVRRKRGHLYVGGRRLDGPAAPARAYIYDYGEIGFQPIALVFPTPGCWAITGRVADARLTFVVLVEKVGAGPDWKFEGLRPSERVTTSPDGS
jgi:hypothetical protein